MTKPDWLLAVLDWLEWRDDKNRLVAARAGLVGLGWLAGCLGWVALVGWLDVQLLLLQSASLQLRMLNDN